MEDFLIGLFLSLLTKFIKNKQHAEQYRAQLEHIRTGIDVVLGPEVPPTTGAQ
jgi:hypothetical protein